MALYERILTIATNYMGVAAEDYIRRRIRIVQRGVEPELITAEKVPRLAAGIEMTAHVYMSARKAAAFRDEILALESDE